MSGVFDINAIANKVPATAETMLIDTRLTDEQEASCRVYDGAAQQSQAAVL